MHVDQARELMQSLQRAIAAADRSGSDEVDLQAQMQALDDKARAELQAAIDAAK